MRKERCALYKWLFLLVFGCMFVGMCKAPAYGETIERHETVVYPVKPYEGPIVDKILDKVAKAVKTQIREAVYAAQVPEVTEAIEEPVEEWYYIGTFTCTAYCPCQACTTDGNGITASGTVATEGRTIACNCLPLGTEVLIDGYTYIVEDTGWTPYGDAWIDFYFDSHDTALAFGVQTKDVFIRR